MTPFNFAYSRLRANENLTRSREGRETISRTTTHTRESELLALPEEVRRKIRLVRLADGFPAGDLRLAVEGERFEF